MLSEIRRDGNYIPDNVGYNRGGVIKDYFAELECQIPQPPHYIKCAKVMYRLNEFVVLKENRVTLQPWTYLLHYLVD